MTDPNTLPRPNEIWQHFKGQRYAIVGMAKHSETLGELVIYTAEPESTSSYPSGDLWARPLSMFLDVHGSGVKRFVRVQRADGTNPQEPNYQDIVDQCPLLFKNDTFYFECAIGWYKPLETVCLALEKIAQEGPEDSRPLVGQVKEKFGGLRFYLDRGSGEETGKLIAEAETECAKTCELCGNPGYTRSGNWVQTLCEEHAKKEY